MSDKGPTGLFGSDDNNRLPQSDSQLNHIFGDRPGHLTDTPKNRQLLLNVANNKRNLIGIDKRGHSWFVETDNLGRQIWAETRNGIIQEGGRNDTPREWDNETGLNKNPFRRKRDQL